MVDEVGRLLVRGNEGAEEEEEGDEDDEGVLVREEATFEWGLSGSSLSTHSPLMLIRTDSAPNTTPSWVIGRAERLSVGWEGLRSDVSSTAVPIGWTGFALGSRRLGHSNLESILAPSRTRVSASYTDSK